MKTDPYFNALRLKFGYAITCHKAQGSEWNHVFVKCRSHQSQLSADYFRWLYTAITRTAQKLYLLDPPNHKPWTDIELVSNPALEMLSAAMARDTPPSAAVLPLQPPLSVSQQDYSTFGIPASAPVPLSVLEEVRKLIDGKGIAIEDIFHHQWQKSYHFKRDAETARIDIAGNRKQYFRAVAAAALGTWAPSWPPFSPS